MTPHETSPASAAASADRIWHPYTRSSAFRDAALPVIVRGEGIHLFDEQGGRWTDAISSWWACSLGHGHPRIVEAIRRQAAQLQHSILGNLSHPPALALAARLAEWMPDPRVRVHFASDGASAVEAALKIALQYGHNRGEPRRRRLLSLEEAYHGDTLGAVSVGYLEQFHAPFRDLLVPAGRLPVPASPAAEPAARERARALFRAHRGEVAALIVEPLCLGAAGMKMYSPDHLRFLFDLCREEGALFISDEIAMGFGRTSHRFAFEHAGIDPDIVCVGKALSAGYLPISAAVVKDAVYATFDDEPADRTFYHGHTFAGNPIAAAAALEALAVYEEERIVEGAAQKGARLAEWMRPLAALPTVREIRCLGLIAAAELRPEVKGPREERRPARVRRALQARRILARPLGDVVYLMPPLNTPDEALREMVEALRDAIEESG